MHLRASSRLVLCAALTLVGCPTNNPTDTGGGGDAGGCPGSMLPTDLPRTSVGTPAMPDAAAADYSCMGSATAPMGGAPVDFTFQLRGFGSGDAVNDATVWFFPDNIVRETCDGTCVELVTDAMGDGMVTSPASGWYAYRVFERPGPTAGSRYVDSVQINEPAPATTGGSVEGNAVSASTLNLIPAAFGFTRVPTTAIIAGAVRDCADDNVRGAIIRLYRADGCEILNGTEASDPHIAYFDGMENPDNLSLFTQVDGLYASANVTAPATGFETIRVEAWARTTDGGPIERVGCEAVGIYENGVSIVNIAPMRSDYPAGHPCAP